MSSFLLDKKPWLYSVSGDRPELPEQDDLVQPGGGVWAQPDLVGRSEHIAVQHRPHQCLHRLPAFKTGRHIHLVNEQRLRHSVVWGLGTCAAMKASRREHFRQFLLRLSNPKPHGPEIPKKWQYLVGFALIISETKIEVILQMNA